MDKFDPEMILFFFMKTNIKIHIEAKEYFGSSYNLENLNIIERTAKITPKKNGQFVTLWKRNIKGNTEPYHESDNFDYFFIKVFFKNSTGVFKFSKQVLIEQGIISTEKKEGNRGFRVYPIWDHPKSKQAIKTQQWQLKYFEYAKKQKNKRS